MNNSWYIIANPASGNGMLAKKWKQIVKYLDKYHIQYEYAYTEEARHEVELTHKAISNGYRKIISVGGDGTLHHVVNGIMTNDTVPSNEVTIGVIPLGTGNDWIKTYNIPNDIEAAIAILSKGKTTHLHVGHLTHDSGSVYFNNVAGIGFDGYVVQRLSKAKRIGAFAYLSSGLQSIIHYKSSDVRIETDERTIHAKNLLTLMGIGKYCGGGMQLIDYTSTQEGHLGITIAEDMNFWDVLSIVIKLFNGNVFSYKKVTTLSSKSITVTPLTDQAVYIEADGELIGHGKVTATLIENAMQCIVPE